MSESKLVYEIMQTIGQYGQVFRTNAGSFYTKSGQRVSGLPKGFTDIMAVMPGGKVCFIECKTDTGKPSPEQEQFINKMRSMGCRAGIVRSVPDALALCGLVE